ncbi:MAG: hypothetical protein AB1758_22055, partial [Candidatus Eremiobacterota bacterium]
ATPLSRLAFLARRLQDSLERGGAPNPYDCVCPGERNACFLERLRALDRTRLATLGEAVADAERRAGESRPWATAGRLAQFGLLAGAAVAAGALGWPGLLPACFLLAGSALVGDATDRECDRVAQAENLARDLRAWGRALGG